ncbi:MAG TPA: hypothetical protein VIZ68_04135 [Thermoplasmata archaeon]
MDRPTPVVPAPGAQNLPRRGRHRAGPPDGFLIAAIVLSVATLSLGTVLLLGSPRDAGANGAHYISARPIGGSVFAKPSLVSDPTVQLPRTPAAISTTASLALQIYAQPTAICANNETTCDAATSQSRVSLTAQAINPPKPYWPDVQVAFIIETTAYDGVFDHYNSFYGIDACATATSGQGPVCEESNGVPFFIANAGSIAASIQGANPRSNVSFAMVDYFGTDCGDWDDCGDGYKYHVDINQFIGADNFASAVRSTFQAQVLGGGWTGIFGLDDNFLHSPSIAALYGTIIGSGLSWSANTHHVIVLIGSTAPRDPAYPENYYASSFDTCCSGSQATGWTCEPANSFDTGASPNCEGWVRSQDGNPDHSIAALAHTATQCTESIGGVCTIDTIDLWDTATDPLSQGWPTSTSYPGGHVGVGPGGTKVQTNVANVISAGCDLSAATGGTWNGPAFATCPNGQAGSLQYVAHGPLSNPNTYNPTLFNALRGIGFGPQYNTLAANGTAKPMFTFVPFSNIAVAANPEFTAACSRGNTFFATCQTVPSQLQVNGIHYLGWNWSTNKSQNAMYAGDIWTASFNIVNTGPPYGVVPVDACTTVACVVAGSGPAGGMYSSATYVSGNNVTLVVASFPLAIVDVQLTPSPGPPGITPPPPPLPPPGLPVVIAPATPVIVPVTTLNSVGISNISLQAAAAGFLGAGFMRVSMKNRPIALRVAAKAGPVFSKFDKDGARGSQNGVGRFV